MFLDISPLQEKAKFEQQTENHTPNKKIWEHTWLSPSLKVLGSTSSIDSNFSTAWKKLDKMLQ